MRPTYALLLGLLALPFHLAKAQDTLIYLNGERIVGKVQEIGIGSVRYSTNSGPNEVVVVSDRNELQRVVLHSGQRFEMNSTPASAPNAAFLARKDQISVDILAPALDHATIGYERVLGRHVNLRVQFGYIGLWRSHDDTERLLNKGWLLRVAPKFSLPRGAGRHASSRDMHPFAGWYLSPELLVSYWSEPQIHYEYQEPYWEPLEMQVRRIFHSSAALNLTIGRQVMLGERFTFDIHGGLGYGVRWINGVATGGIDRRYSDDQYQFSHVFLGDRTPLSASGGLSFGYIF